MAISNFQDLVDSVNSTLQGFAAHVGLDVTSSNDSDNTDFTKAMGTFINSPSAPWTSSTINLDASMAVRGGMCAIWYKGAALSSSSFTGGTIVLYSGQNTADELCLVFIMHDRTNNAFTVNIQTGFTGSIPSVPGVPVAPTSIAFTVDDTYTAGEPPQPISITLTEGDF